MSENRKYYWLKLKEDFFEDKTTKYLQSLPDGYKLIICYLKMQLKALKTDGVIKYDRLFPTNVEELALILDEDINIVKLMLEALKRIGAVEELNDGSLAILAMEELVGSETNWAKLKRQQRQKLDNVQQVSRKCLPEIEIEIEKDIDIKKENIKEKKSNFEIFYKAYPRKVGKANVEKWFNKNKPSEDLFDLMMKKLELFKKSPDWLKDNGQFIPYPATWLNQKRWEDEIYINGFPIEQPSEEKYIEIDTSNMSDEEYARTLVERRKRNEGK